MADQKVTDLTTATPQVSDAFFIYAGKAAGALDRKVAIGTAAGKDVGTSNGQVPLFSGDNVLTGVNTLQSNEGVDLLLTSVSTDAAPPSVVVSGAIILDGNDQIAGGSVQISATSGQSATSNGVNPGAGGDLSLSCGSGGSVFGGNASGNDGGNLTIFSGEGSTGSGTGGGGLGGTVNIYTGRGGDGGGTSGNGATSGMLSISTNEGGNATNGNGGHSGGINIFTGAGGTGDLVDGVGGNVGNIEITCGVAGGGFTAGSPGNIILNSNGGEIRLIGPLSFTVCRILTSDMNFTDTTLATTNLGLVVPTTGVYKIKGMLFQADDAAGGSKYDFSLDDGLTLSAAKLTYTFVDPATNAITVVDRVTDVTTDVSQTGVTGGHWIIEGCINVSAKGTLSLRGAQAADTGTSTLQSMSYMEIFRYTDAND